METSTLQRAVLLADITGSTSLYEKAGDDAAARQIGQCIDWMKDIVVHGHGVFVAAKGDDVLATFEAAEPALSRVHASVSAKSFYVGESFGVDILVSGTGVVSGNFFSSP